MGVAGGGTWVGAPVARIMVLVACGAELVGGATVTDMSHATATTTNRERNRNPFFMA
jgi:hypothetical protein